MALHGIYVCDLLWRHCLDSLGHLWKRRPLTVQMREQRFWFIIAVHPSGDFREPGHQHQWCAEYLRDAVHYDGRCQWNKDFLDEHTGYRF